MTKYMRSYIRQTLTGLLLLSSMILQTGCSSWKSPLEQAGHQPEIFPDYKDITAPCNIAPLNFMVDGADRIQAVVYIDGEEVHKTVGKYGVISFPQKKWNTILEQFPKNLFRNIAAYQYPSGKDLPRLYEEALVLISMTEPQVLAGFTISEDTQRRFYDYVSLMNAGKGNQALRKHADTYWAYSY